MNIYTGDGLSLLRLWPSAPKTNAVRVTAKGGNTAGVAYVWQGAQWLQHGARHTLVAPDRVNPGDSIGVDGGRISIGRLAWPILEGVP